ncbi:hypothetical protein EVAR_44826_1 [Eumeta japonica]|uniref:Uncharacterized protein n=1 Tax=Eumeta variegata TaxID=151549 RepID=A0A4C1X741_EUMVA|nr:hypothetical protein EVAR_44826_1 [Eumeta japonica]
MIRFISNRRQGEGDPRVNQSFYFSRRSTPLSSTENGYVLRLASSCVNKIHRLREREGSAASAGAAAAGAGRRCNASCECRGQCKVD